MADPDHLSKLRQGVDAWNAWRKTEDVIPDLRQANFSEANLSRANLSLAFLEGAYLNRANLRRANLRGATFGGADLWGAGLARRFPASVYLDRA